MVENEIVISLKEGKIQGIKEKSHFSGTEFFSFYGVPYAQPPIGALRFKDPIKVKPWKCIRDSTKPREGCTQISPTQLRLVGSEDCLYVNVHTPQLPQEGKPLKSIIAFLHPGGHTCGSPDPIQHGSPNFVMHRDIVYVTICYRLNIFGFLDLKLPECCENQGLKDVIMAFQWIKENIHMFNGDPGNVTAFGASSGGSITQILMLSPAVKGLFHKAIITGQHMFNCLILYRTNQSELAFQFGHHLGFKGNDPKKLLNFFKKIPGHVLVVQMGVFRQNMNANLCKAFEGNIFMETIDGKIFPDSPRKFINSTERIPIIFGICHNESAFHFNQSSTLDKKYFRQSLWGWVFDLDNQQLDQLAKQVESFYCNNKDMNTASLSTKMDILTDAAFSDVYDTLLNVISADLPSSVYVYKFQYMAELGLSRNPLSLLLNEPVDGTFHIDDLYHWAHFYEPKTRKTRQVINTYTKLLTTFAKTGNPNYEGIEVQWKSTTPEDPSYLEINKELSVIDGKLNNTRFEFWKNMKKQFKGDSI